MQMGTDPDEDNGVVVASTKPSIVDQLEDELSGAGMLRREVSPAARLLHQAIHDFVMEWNAHDPGEQWEKDVVNAARERLHAEWNNLRDIINATDWQPHRALD